MVTKINHQKNKIMKKLAWLIIIILSTSCQPKNKGIEKLQKQVDSLQTELNNVYKPGFGESMDVVHHHYQEIWQAGIDKNWEYAHFELKEMMEAVENIEKFQKDRKEVELLNMLDEPVQHLMLITEQKDEGNFKNAYINLTKTCNACHLQTNYAFIKIEIPTND